MRCTEFLMQVVGGSDPERIGGHLCPGWPTHLCANACCDSVALQSVLGARPAINRSCAADHPMPKKEPALNPPPPPPTPQSRAFACGTSQRTRRRASLCKLIIPKQQCRNSPRIMALRQFLRTGKCPNTFPRQALCAPVPPLVVSPASPLPLPSLARTCAVQNWTCPGGLEGLNRAASAPMDDPSPF